MPTSKARLCQDHSHADRQSVMAARNRCNENARETSRLLKAGTILAFGCLVIIAEKSAFTLTAARSVVETSNKLQFINKPEVSIFSPRASQTAHPAHSAVVDDLMARITSALSAVGGDDQAIRLADDTTPTVDLTTSNTLATGQDSSPASTEKTAPSSTSRPQSETTDEASPDSAAKGGAEHEARSEEEEDECKGLFVTSGDTTDDQTLSESKHLNLTDTERLVALQTCLQAKVRRRLKGSARSSMELFEKLNLSGGCTSSLVNLMAGLSEIKSYAFKFLDASAKIPSGVMYGLLSDFGDFDQCLSIRSNPHVPPEIEAEEGAYSGKYCLLNIRFNYHVRLAPNSSVPEGIYEDGVLWDELVRNYWTSKSTKGFQLGVCVPSRCSNDDLEQIYKAVAESYNVLGEVSSCQDGNDLRRQTSPDVLQLAILCAFAALFLLNIVGTLVERYMPAESTPISPAFYQMIVCFSIRRNWKLFMRERDAPTVLAFNYDEAPMHNQLVSCVGSGSEQESVTNSIETKQEDQPLTIKMNSDIQSPNGDSCMDSVAEHSTGSSSQLSDHVLSHLTGLKLVIIVWITIGHSFLYPSANNYQYYRSIINMNITRDSVWFAATNFTLGIDMLLYVTGLVFAYKFTNISQFSPLVTRPMDGKCKKHLSLTDQLKNATNHKQIIHEIARKVLRFWPSYSAVIALAIVTPLMGDGPMWPEMISRRIGDTCRRNWWTNLLVMNNFLDQGDICVPSSWFVSVLMQLFVVGSMITIVARKYSVSCAMLVISALLIISSAISFCFAYHFDIQAPAIRMDESFVLELDNNIFKLYTNIFNNMGPFMVGMVGGLVLVRWQAEQARKYHQTTKTKTDGDNERLIKECVKQLCLLIVIVALAILVLSSVFYKEYTKHWSAIYWSLHRVGWAVVTGYLIHQCATGRWKFIKDLLSLSHLIPFSRLIFIAYLVYPIFIHIHSGLVRDGLHVSTYNMANIYITRLVLTFTMALIIHILVELPFCSIESILLTFGKTTRNR